MKKTIMILIRHKPVQYRICAYCFQEVEYEDDYCKSCGREFMLDGVLDSKWKRYAKRGELWK